MARGLVAAMFAASLVIVGPAAPATHAIPNPCNLPGGKTVCEKAVEGAEWYSEVSGTKTIAEGADNVGEVIDFASDPFGYMEQKLRAGTKGMFSAFGEELTGEKVGDRKKGKTTSKGD